MSKDRPELYFKNDIEWRSWLLEHHNNSSGIYLILYKVNAPEPSMRWEEAVKVALCFGWIDSTVKRIDDTKRKQLFIPRKPKSVSQITRYFLCSLRTPITGRIQRPFRSNKVAFRF